MSMFDAAHRLQVLIFSAGMLCLSCAEISAQQVPAVQPPDQPAVSTPGTTQSEPTPSPETPVTPSPSDGSGAIDAASQLRYIANTPPPTPEQVGDSYSARRRYQLAIAAYSKADPITPAIWNKMGIAYQMMFAIRDAVRCYEKSLKLEPKNSQVMNNLATVYDSQKEYKMAEKLYRKALKIDPKSALIHRNLGSNLMAQHKYKKGAEAYRAALAIDPNIFDSHGGASVQNPAPAQERGALHYYMAKGCVSAGNVECAIQNLRLAMNEGYTNAKKVVNDDAFASIRELPGFQQLIASQTPQQTPQ